MNDLIMMNSFQESDESIKELSVNFSARAKQAKLDLEVDAVTRKRFDSNIIQLRKMQTIRSFTVSEVHNLVHEVVVSSLLFICLCLLHCFDCGSKCVNLPQYKF